MGKATDEQVQVGFGGSCHWCTEAVFASLKAVSRVQQGYLAAPAPDNSFSEGVLIDYDPAQIELHDLIAIHLYTHSATVQHAMRQKYRSAIYVCRDVDRQAALQSLAQLQQDFVNPLVTRVLDFKAFKDSRAQFKNYYYEDPQRPFCQAYINPKLERILQRHGQHVDAEKAEIIKQSLA